MAIPPLEDLLNFVELRPFTLSWHELELTDEDLLALQLAIMARPKRHPVVPGTGCLRKTRFAGAASRRGKSGGVRVGYVYLEESFTVLLVLAYAKSERDDFSPAEKKSIKQLIAAVKKEFGRRIIR